MRPALDCASHHPILLHGARKDRGRECSCWSWIPRAQDRPTRGTRVRRGLQGARPVSTPRFPAVSGAISHVAICLSPSDDVWRAGGSFDGNAGSRMGKEKPTAARNYPRLPQLPDRGWGPARSLQATPRALLLPIGIPASDRTAGISTGPSPSPDDAGLGPDIGSRWSLCNSNGSYARPLPSMSGGNRRGVWGRWIQLLGITLAGSPPRPLVPFPETGASRSWLSLGLTDGWVEAISTNNTSRFTSTSPAS